MTDDPVRLVPTHPPAARGATPAGRSSGPRRRHPAHGARIAAAGIGATTMLGLVGVMGFTEAPAAAPAAVSSPQPPTATARPGDGASSTKLTVRPTVRPATPAARAPAASSNGSR